MIMSSWTGYKKFNKGIKRYVELLAFVLMISLAFSAQADSSYISIQEMREAVHSTWTETLKGGKKEFDCTIDAAVVVPEVESFPVLLVDYQGEIPGVEGTGYYVDDNTKQELLVKTTPDEKMPKEDLSQEIVLHEDELTEEFIRQAEENSREILGGIWDMNGTNLERLGVVVYQTENTAYRDTVVYYCPTYNGIAYLEYAGPFGGAKGYVEPPHNRVYTFCREDIDYNGAYINIPRLIGEYLADVPLLPFENIQEVIRKRIRDGYIQSICEIRLGYVGVNNPEKPGENFYLTPAWVVCGVMNSYPDLPFYPDDYSQELRYESTLIINAQTGEVIDVHSHSKETFEAHILTWEDVK